MATLSGNKIKNTYQSLVKFSDNGNITTSAKQLTDGFGNNSPMFVSTTQVGIGVTPESGLNLHVFGDAKIGSNLTVIGNLVVEGSTTTVGTDTLTVKDPLIVLANNNTSTDAVDIGFYGKYTPSGTTLYSGLFREALTGKYRLFKGLEVEPTTTVNTSGTGYAVASLVANLEGNVTGNLTGNVTGNITGNVTGGTISGTIGTFSGDVNVNSNFIVTTGTPTSADPNGSHVIAKIDSSAGYDTGGLEIHTGDNNGDEPALLHTNYNGDEAFRISSLGHIISTGNGTFTGSLSASFFKGDVYANDGTSKILENGTDGTDATFTGDVTGGLTGDVTGDVTGNLTGDVTGDITGNVTATSVLADGVTATTQSADDNSTKVATTAYVDALEVSSTLSEILANGNTSGANNIIMADLQSIYFGTDSDFQLSHNNSGNSFIQHLGTGTLFIRNNTAEQVIKLQAKNSIDVVNDYVIINGETERTEFGKDVEIKNGHELYFHDALEIWHNSSNSNIINNTGNLIITQKTDDGDIIFKSDDGSGGVTEYFRVDGGDEKVIYGRSIQMADNVSVYFGNDTANDGYIKWDSTANELFVNGPVKVLETLDVVGNSTFAGNVGIVLTDTNSVKLGITGNSGLPATSGTTQTGLLRLKASNNASLDMGCDHTTANGWLQVTDVTDLSSEYNLLLQPNGGNVGIGTASPNAILEIASGNSGGDAALDAPVFRINNTTESSDWDVDDVVGSIEYYTSDASGNAPYVTSFIKSVNETGNGTLPDGALVFGTATYNASGGAVERMRIDSSGNVGIGTDSPSAKLDVRVNDSINNDSTNALRITHTTSGTTASGFGVGLGFFTENSTYSTINETGRIEVIETNEVNLDDDMLFYTKGNNTLAERMRIDSSGNVGIGTTSPVQKLHLNNSATLTATYQKFTNGTATTGTTLGIDADGDFLINNGEAKEIKLYTNDTQRLTIQSGGNVGIGTTSPNNLLNLSRNVGNGDVATYIQNFNADVGSTNETASVKFAHGNDGGIGYVGAKIVCGKEGDFETSIVNIKGNLQFYTASGTSLDSDVNNIERMRINSSGVTTLTAEGYQLAIKDESSGNISEILTSNTAMGFFADRANAVANTSMIFSIDNDTKMTIDSSGNVGIGTNSPGHKLHVENTESATWTTRFSNTVANSNNIYFGYNNGTTSYGMYINGGQGAAGYDIQTASGFTVRGAGNVGIGDTNPSFILDTNITSTRARFKANTGDANIELSSIAGRDWLIQSKADSSFAIYDEDASAERMRITSGGDLHVDGDVVAYSTTISDKRLKDNVKPLESSLDKVMNLKGVEYVWNNGSRKGQKDIGFIAQEVEDVIPEIVREKQVIFNKEEKYKTVDYEKITAVLVEAVKELTAKVERLENNKCNCK